MSSITRVRKPMAKSLYDCGLTIYLLPNKINPNNSWIKPTSISVYQRDDYKYDFEYILNQFRYYNCNNELGKDIHYYVEDFHNFCFITSDNTVLKHKGSADVMQNIKDFKDEIKNIKRKKVEILNVKQDGDLVTVLLK